jgi:hypothetical protein
MAALAMAGKKPAPVDVLELVAPYPSVRPSGRTETLASLARGRPTVLHLYTG